MQGNYSPGLMPGGSQSRPDVDSSAQPQRGNGLSAIESRLHSLRSNSKVLSLDPQLKTFMDTDVEYLMRVARAAERWSNATNAEASRAAAGAVHAAVRNA